MSLLINALGTCIGNLLVFSAIPFAWWSFRHRKEENFLRWVGIRKPHIKVKWAWLAVFAVAYLILYNFDGELLIFTYMNLHILS